MKTALEGRFFYYFKNGDCHRFSGKISWKQGSVPIFQRFQLWLSAFDSSLDVMSTMGITRS